MIGPFNDFRLGVILARHTFAPVAAGLPSAADAPLRRSELAKSAKSSRLNFDFNRDESVWGHRLKTVSSYGERCRRADHGVVGQEPAQR
jgi:hypothetical protein